MKNRFKKFLLDPRGYTNYGIRSIWINILGLYLTTLLCYFSTWAWNIRIGKRCKFYGMAKFVRAPSSSITIGDNCRFRSSNNSNLIGINHPCMVSTHSNGSSIKIGSGCGFSGTVIASREKIVIGNDVICGANTTITDFDWHQVNPIDRASKTPGSISAPVNIGNNVWLGLNVIVLKGVTIGSNVTIAAGSIVTSSIPENCLAGGIPARIIKEF